jgi:hypothetical protein
MRSRRSSDALPLRPVRLRVRYEQLCRDESATSSASRCYELMRSYREALEQLGMSLTRSRRLDMITTEPSMTARRQNGKGVSGHCSLRSDRVA